MGHFKWSYQNLKKTENDASNMVTKKVQVALLLVVHSLVHGCILDSWALFHTTSYQEIIQNHVVGDFGKLVYLVDGEVLYVIGIRYMCITFPNKKVWSLHKVGYILELKKNMISVGQVDVGSQLIIFSNDIWKVTGAMVLARHQNWYCVYDIEIKWYGCYH